MDNPAPLSQKVLTHTYGLDCEIAVIGAGIIGVCIAIELQAAGHDVWLIDRKGVAEECSYGNAGHIAVEHIFPLSSPATLMQVPKMLLQPNGPLSIRAAYLPQLMPWLMRFLWAGRPVQVRRGTEAIAALNARALPAYRSLDARFDLGGLLVEDGTLVVFESEKNLSAASREQRLLTDFGVETALMDATELKAFDPSLSPALKGAVCFPASAHVTDPAALVRMLASRFTQRGGHIERQAVTGMDHSPTHLGLTTSRDRVRAQKVVIAAGAWSHQLARMLGYKVPLETERGYHLMLDEPTVMPRVPTTYHERRFVATPMDARLRLAGRVELGGLQLPPNIRQAHALMPQGQDLLPDLQAQGATPWMGFRPTLPDSLPVIGPAPRHKGVYFAFGHNHMGLTHGAITGELMRDLIGGKVPGIDLTPYRIDRF
ncbi:NAD(P)/FAD-dependent oxidoreductase [Kordiimonas lipolytica]|uniref:NAD(P)/FAD-dependent oxidoreductase n=1 Tax=Kordiimonas lipolytica TaxID=1662421 RepID=A0ABV8UG73_9PROT|nr:FAD-binding oxidoreductase [Kordiimonas lipolytica]